MDYLSSMYIDNEMDLVEKRQFVEKIRSDRSFFKQTVELLIQEQQLRELPTMPVTIPEKPWRPPVWILLVRLFKPVGFAGFGFTAAVLIFFSGFQQQDPSI